MSEYTMVRDLQEEGIMRLEKLTLTVQECSKITGIGEMKIRELVHTKGFPVVWNGNRALIIRDEINGWLKDNIGQKI